MAVGNPVVQSRGGVLSGLQFTGLCEREWETGGPGRDRTDDVFHDMEGRKCLETDSKRVS